MTDLEREYLGLLWTAWLAPGAPCGRDERDEPPRLEPLSEWVRPHLFSAGTARFFATALADGLTRSHDALVARLESDPSPASQEAAAFVRGLAAAPPPVDLALLDPLRRRLEDRWRAGRARAAWDAHTSPWASNGVDAAGLERLAQTFAALARRTRSPDGPVVALGTSVRAVFKQTEEAFETQDPELVRAARAVPDHVPRVAPATLAPIADGLLDGSVHAVAVADGPARTQLVVGLVELLALQRRRPVLLLTEVRTHEELTVSLFSAVADVPHQRITSGALRETDWPRLARAADQLFNAPLETDDSGALSLDGLPALVARRAAASGRLPVVVVDPHVGRHLDALLQELDALGPGLGASVLLVAPIDPAGGTRDAPPELPSLRYGCGWVFAARRHRGEPRRYELFTIRADGSRGRLAASGTDLVDAREP